MKYHKYWNTGKKLNLKASKQASKHTANTGGDSEIRASVKQFQHWLLRQKLYLGKIFCCYFVLFQKAETGKGNLREQTIACRIYFLTTVQDNSSFVE